MLHLFLITHIHGEDGSHGINRSNEDSNLTDSNGEQQPPGGLTVGLPLTEDLRQPEADGADLTEVNEGKHLRISRVQEPWLAQNCQSYCLFL